MELIVLVIAAGAYMAFAQPELMHAPASNSYVADNLRETLYHELGHAIIDQEALPIFGQEEDAADVFSALMIQWMNTPSEARRMVQSVAGAYRNGANNAEKSGGTDFTDVHGPDMQRLFNLACLYYGGATNEAQQKKRQDFVTELGLSEDRLNSCEDEYTQAYNAWHPVFVELQKNQKHPSFTLVTEDKRSLSSRVLGREIRKLNRRIHLTGEITIRLEPCEEANAFYDHDSKYILFCSELEGSLADAASKN